MFPRFRHFRIAIVTALVLLLVSPASVEAGWMGFRNDTGKTLVIQETVSVGTGSRPGKPQKIFANETVRDTALSGAGQRMLAIYDAAHPDKALFTGQFPAPAKNENVLYVIKLNKGEVVIDAIKTPVVSAPQTKTLPKR